MTIYQKEVCAERQTGSINTRMNLMSAIGIILVVCGHQACGAFSIGNLFPYYSYHLPLFIFISGYFYSAKAEMQPVRYLGKKAKSLLGYFLIWQCIYALLSTILSALTDGAFTIGPKFSLYEIVVKPLTRGTGGFTTASWYLISFFYVLAINVFLRKILKSLKIEKEIIIALLYTMGGYLCIALTCSEEYTWPVLRVFQIFCMLPFFELGYLYRRYLEKLDTISNSWYFAIILAAQTGMLLISGEKPNVVIAQMTGFSHPLLFYGFAITGIALVLRISRILDSVIGQSRLVMMIGRNTKMIMMHHQFIYFVLHLLLAWFAAETGLINEADMSELFTNVYYHYYPMGNTAFSFIYVVLCVIIPVGILNGWNYLKKVFCRKGKRRL